MANPKTYTQRFKSFSRGFCPYCGTQGATLTEDSKHCFHGQCVNPECKAHNFFSNPKCKDWL